jgi:hypothetical protein
MFAEYLETPVNWNLWWGPNLMHAGRKISVMSVLTAMVWAINVVSEKSS